MITQNELIDLSFCLVLIRGNIRAAENIPVLESLIALLQNTAEPITNNTIRQTLAKLNGLGQAWAFCRHENVYVKTVVYKNSGVLVLLCKNLVRLKELLQLKQFEQATDLADALHTLPEVIAENGGYVSRRYFKAFARPYQQKWNEKIGRPKN